MVHSGLINFTRSDMTSVFSLPIVPLIAGSWRLIFVTQISSISINVSSPMPERAKASTTQEPTPPMPITQIWALRKRASPSGV